MRFVQTAGGRMGLPAPRRVRGKSFFKIASASAWTTLQLIVYADGQAKGSLLGASPFPRHWIYGDDGEIVEKSGTIDFENGTGSPTASRPPGATRTRRPS